MDIKIRPGLLFDIPLIADFQMKLAWETENFALDPTTVEKGVTAVFDDPSKGKYWLAENQGNAIACLLTIPEWSDWRNGTVLWIHSVYVKSDFRAQGVFGKLYKHLKELALATDEIKGLRLYVEKQNLKAQKVYEHLGMSAEHYHLYEWTK